MSNDDDVGFLSLAPNLRSRIDNAFRTALASDQRGSGAFTVGLTHDAPGGFLIDDDDSMAGGFVPPSPPARTIGSERERDEQPSYIPLSRIPHALQLLDLSPNDEDVLAVFRNAATGWEDDHISGPRSTRRGRNTVATTDESDEAEERVSLRDWRAVCAALMEDGRDEEGAGDVDIGEDDDENAGDIVQNSSSSLEESSCESSDEYHDAETVAKSRKRPRTSTSASTAGHKTTRKSRQRKTKSTTPRRADSVSASTALEITPRQRRECLQTFLLFFPGVPEDAAKLRRLGVRELSAAAAVLNEKIKTEEVRRLDS
jgi:hypothetical protein